MTALIRNWGPLVAIVFVLGWASVAVAQGAPLAEPSAAPSIEHTLATNALGGGASALTSLALFYFWLKRQAETQDKKLAEIDAHLRTLQVEFAELRATIRRDD